jgi:hypothetical protein
MPIPLKAHAHSVFLARNHFAEPVAYRAEGRPIRTINAVVARDPLQATPGQNIRTTDTFLVEVANDSIKGVLLDDIQIDNDTIELPDRDKGRTPVTYIVRRIVSQDAGMIVLEVAS